MFPHIGRYHNTTVFVLVELDIYYSFVPLWGLPILQQQPDRSSFSIHLDKYKENNKIGFVFVIYCLLDRTFPLQL